MMAEEMECARNMIGNCTERTEFQGGNVIFLKKELKEE